MFLVNRFVSLYFVSCNAILFTWQGNALMGQVKFGKMTQNYFCFCRFFEAVHFVSPPTLINYWTFGGSVKQFCTLACSLWHWPACLCCWSPSISFERANAEKCPWHLQIQSHMAKIGAFAFRLPRRSFMLGIFPTSLWANMPFSVNPSQNPRWYGWDNVSETHSWLVKISMWTVGLTKPGVGHRC